MGFQVPKFEIKTKRQVEIEFSGDVAVTNGYLTLVAGPITYPFRIIGGKLHFDQEANNAVEYRFYLSGNSNAVVGGWPSDSNLLGPENPNAGYFGRSVVKDLNVCIEVSERNQYIKFAAHNTNGYVYRATASIVIQEV